MLTLDAIRAAVLSDQPWNRLDELVRAEQAAGRKVKEIYADLMSLADDIDATPGLSEDGSDAFGDTLDALTGYCNPDECYQDPPNTTLPSEEEIAKLPRWARVAFAARCARRVFPLLKGNKEIQVVINHKAIERALMMSERAAAEATGSNEILNRIAREADEGVLPTFESASEVMVASSAADAAHAASWAAAEQDVSGKSDSKITQHTHKAADASHSAWMQIEKRELATVIRRDFDHLASLAEWQKWDDGTPVPPEVFGPLWPEGPPKGWPPVTDIPQRADLAIEMFARERATEQMIEDDIVNLFNALNRYHIARSGVRLTLEQFQSLIAAFVPAEA